MSIFEYLPEFYKVQWGDPLFPFRGSIIMALVFLNCIIFDATLRARKNLDGISFIFLPGATLFIAVSFPIGIDFAMGLMAITATFISFLEREAKYRKRDRAFTDLYMQSIAEVVMEARTGQRSW